MEPETKKIDIKKVLITLGLVILTAATIGGGTYYVLNQNFKKEREANEKALKEINDKFEKLEEQKATNTTTTSKPKDSSIDTTDWKTYNNFVFRYNIKYPNNWLFKEYGSNIRADQALSVCFAKTESELPAPESDQSCPVRIGRSNELPYSDASTATKENLVINGKNVTKINVPANLPTKMGNWNEVIYAFPYGEIYITVSNSKDYELSIFESMVKTMSFYTS